MAFSDEENFELIHGIQSSVSTFTPVDNEQSSVRLIRTGNGNKILARIIQGSLGFEIESHDYPEDSISGVEMRQAVRDLMVRFGISDDCFIRT